MSYITPHLYLGDANHAQNFDFLKKKNIKLIINCAKEIPDYYPDKFKYIRLDWDDTLNQRIIKELDKIADIIGLAIRKGQVVYVHCAAGISRSATVVIYTLMKLHNWDFNRSYLFVKEFRPVIKPNPNFVEQIMKLSGGMSSDERPDEPETFIESEHFERIQNFQEIQPIKEEKITETKFELESRPMLHPEQLNLKPPGKGNKYVKMDRSASTTDDTRGTNNWSKLTFDCKDCESPSFIPSGRGSGIYARIFS